MSEILTKYSRYGVLFAGMCFIIPFVNITIQNFLWVISVHAVVPGGLLSIVAGLLIVRFLNRDFSRKEFAVVVIIFVAYSALAMLVSGYFYDGTRDGVSYHQEAVIQLKEGWNPVREKLPLEIPIAFFINHYPKAAWVNDGTIFAISGHLEQSKMLNLLYPVGAFLLALFLLVKLNIKFMWAALISLLAVLDSIMIVQLLSFMVDQINASVMTSLVAVMLLIFVVPEKRNYWYVLVVALAVVFDTKFTSIVNLIMMMSFFVGAVFLFSRKHLRMAVVLSVVTGISYVGINVNPYITNVAEGKHPLYPVFGGTGQDILDGEIPANYVGGNRVVNFTNSIFSVSTNGTEPSVLKWPGTMSWKEFAVFPAMYDMRKGGFGVTFSLYLLVSLALASIVFLKTKSKGRFIILYSIVAITTTAVVNPANWWARLVPQFWLVPIFCLVMVLLHSNGVLLKAARITILLALTVQGFCLAAAVYYQNTITTQVRNQLREFRAEGAGITVDFRKSYPARQRLNEAHVPYKEEKFPKVADELHLEHTTAAYRK